MKRCLVLVALLCGCETPSQKQHAAASKVLHPMAEAGLPIVRLTSEASSRLGIETTVVREGVVPRARLVGGEIVVPPGRAITVTAPVAGQARFVTSPSPIPGARLEKGAAVLQLTAIAPADRDTRARASREVTAAEANLAALELRVARNEELFAQQSGSARALEEAVAARDVAQADLATARARASTLSKDPLLSDVTMLVRAPSSGVIRSLSVAEGQAVAGGAALFEVVEVETLQVRVSVYSGDLGRLDLDRPASVRRNGEQRSIEGRPVPGPPTAEPDRSTVDRYFALSADGDFSPGERVLVDLPFRDKAEVLTVPASALVFDAWGGVWVYRCEGGDYWRTRVDPIHRIVSEVALAHGPPAHSCVVSVGAAELFGTEFPPGH